jgi:hypothetical protein
MKVFVPLLLILSILPISARPPNTQFNSGKKFSGADRTITWGPWQQKPKDEFRFRTGDRYLGRAPKDLNEHVSSRRNRRKSALYELLKLLKPAIGYVAFTREGPRSAE